MIVVIVNSRWAWPRWQVDSFNIPSCDLCELKVTKKDLATLDRMLESFQPYKLTVLKYRPNAGEQLTLKLHSREVGLSERLVVRIQDIAEFWLDTIRATRHLTPPSRPAV